MRDQDVARDVRQAEITDHHVVHHEDAWARAAGAESVFTKPVDWETILAFVTPAHARNIPRSRLRVVPALDLPLSA